MKYMTKAEAISLFREEYSPHIPKGDAVMRREEWNNFTDGLCKDHRISPRQYDTWANPF